MRILSRSDVKQALPMRDAIEAMKRAFSELSGGRAIVPLRTMIPIPDRKGLAGFMPGYIPADDQVAIKIVSVFHDNAKQGLPLIQALVVVIDGTNGEMLAVIEGGYLTALRTGAASGAATSLLARQDARVAAILGTGVQGQTQLEAVCAVRTIQEAWVYDLSNQRAATFAEEMTQQLGIPVHAVGTPGEAVSRADVICTATTSASPVFDDRDVLPGAHINAVGAHTPQMQEIPAETVARALVVVDQREACMAEAGDLLIPLGQGVISQEQLTTELGEVVSGEKAGRTLNDQITLFKSVGVAVQDVAAAAAILRAAERLDLGTVVTL